MTLVHDDLPTDKLGIHRPVEEVAAWQATHEPVLRVAVWLGADNRVMVHVGWKQSVQDAELMCKPLPEMGRAVVAVYRTMTQLAEALAVVDAERRVFEGAPQA